jgi:type II secretory pathway component GspD/PulD (secretin)
LLAAIVALVAMTGGLAIGSELPDANAPYRYVSKNQDLTAVIRFFGRNLGIAVNVDPGVSGNTTPGTDRQFTRRTYLERLAAEFGLVWFFDGSTLHVNSSNKVETEVFPLRQNNGVQVVETLVHLGMYQPKFTHRFDLRTRVFLVSGPPAYVQIVKKTVKALKEAERTRVTVLRGAVEIPLVPPIAHQIVSKPLQD